MPSCLIAVAALTLILSKGLSAELYEWSCTPLDVNSSRYTLPDLQYHDDQNVSSISDDLASTDSERVDIYPLPLALNCAGTVSAVEFCYARRVTALNNIIDFGTDNHLFTLLTLEQNNLSFTITNMIDVWTTPTAQKCTDQTVRSLTRRFCCDTVMFEASDQFSLPASTNFAFGVIPRSQISQLRYDSEVFPELRVEQFTTSVSDLDTPAVGDTITLSDDDRRRDVGLRLLQFTIVPAATEARTTAPPIPPTTPSIPPTTPNMNTTEASATGDDFLGAALGAALGGGVAIIVLLVISTVVIVVLKRRVLLKEKEKPQNRSFSYKNETAHFEESLKHDYAEEGPHVYSNVENPALYEIPWSHEYSYALDGAAMNSGAGYDSNVYEAVNDVIIPKKKWEEEKIYMAPGKDENTLYSQLDEIIRTGGVTRHTLRLGDNIGSGHFGTVYKGVWQSSEKGAVEVAVKTLNEESTQEDKIKFLQEAAIMGQFKHPNVVEMYGVITDKEPILLVLEFLKRGDLREYLLNMRPADNKVSVAIDAHTLLSYCRQVASGMAYLSNKAFVHRDLAARNVLVSEENKCKIADFGMSRDLMDETYYISHGGKIPVKWTAPEALHYKKYSTASDVWSYGALMYEIWSVGHKPYEQLTVSQVIKKVDAGYRLPPPPGCPRALYSIMIQCWHPVTSKRPSFQDIESELKSLPEAELLKWTEKDRQTHPDADKLGADLDYAQDLYKDLQTLYHKNTN